MLYLLRSILLLICITGFFATFIVGQEKQGNELFPISVKRKSGFIDKAGKVVIEPQFDAVDNFSDGLAKIYTRGKFSTAYIDKTGKIVIEPQFDIGSKFSEGFAWVGFSPNKTEYKIGNLTLYSDGQGSDSFNYNIAFIDKTGRFITEPVFTFAEDFSEGLAVVRTKENKFGFIDKTGKFAINPSFDWAYSFSEGLAIVVKNKKYGFINKKGKFVIRPKFTDAENFSEGLACVKIGGQFREANFGMQTITTTIDDTNYAFIDKKGKIVFRIKAREVHPFSEELARFQLFGKNEYGFVDKTGKITLEPIYAVSSDFFEGLNQMYLGQSKYGYIDKTGKTIIKTDFQNVDDFKNGLAKVCESYEDNARCGYIDKTGKIIWQPTK